MEIGTWSDNIKKIFIEFWVYNIYLLSTTYMHAYIHTHTHTMCVIYVDIKICIYYIVLKKSKYSINILI